MGNTRLYSDSWTWSVSRPSWRSPATSGVNLAGVEIILNMRRKIEQMQQEVNEFVGYVKQELTRGLGDWEQRLGTALVKASPTDLVRSAPSKSTPAARARRSSRRKS